MIIRAIGGGVLVAAPICFASGSAHATDIYVQQGSTASPAGTMAAPYTTVYMALQAASRNLSGLSPDAPQQNQVIHLETPIGSPGYYGNFAVQYSGKSNGYIVIVGASSTSSRVRVVGDGGHFGIQVAGVAYVAIQNLDVTAPGPWSAIFVDAHSNNIQVAGNVTHDSGLCGISTYEADYLTISYNTVYNNAGYYSSTMSPRITCSGISTDENTDIDTYTGVKSIINGNVVYNNSNYNAKCTGACGDADGNGIIVDDSAHNETDDHPYGGTTLITNNIVVGNGGRGIYMFQSDHVMVENNTAYYNNQDPQESAYIPGEIEVYGMGSATAGGGGDIGIYDNIAYSDGRAAAFQPPYTHNGDHEAITLGYAGNDGKGGVTADYNMVYAATNMPASIYGSGGDSSSVVYGSHNITANPMFVAASTNPATASFALQSTSPALHAGVASHAACSDIDSTARPSTSVMCDPSGLTYKYGVDLGGFPADHALGFGHAEVAMPHPETWLKVLPQGLFCEPGGFFIDPVGAVDRAVITHAHADHARPGHAHVLASPATLAIMRVRMGAERAGTAQQALGWGEEVDVGGVRVQLAPAGHVLGSAQVVMEWRGSRAVVSGDYKRVRDPTCDAFEPAPCDVFVTEATFALPVFRHPKPEHEIARLLASVALFPERTHVVGCYALGKCQRVIALLRRAGWDAPIYLHGALASVCEEYERLGVALGDLRPATVAGKDALRGAIVLAPPGAIADRWARRLSEPVVCLASGWMRVRQRAKSRGVELPLVISDHADWDELLATLDDVGAPEVWVTHGREEALIHAAEKRGVRGRALRLVGYEDDEEAA